MIRVAEWVRVSDESQAAPERFGIPAQRTVNRETCKRYSLEIVKTFQVEDVSGKDIMLAPETHELIELMHSGRIQGVVAREFSRLMRPDDFGDYVLLGAFQKTNTILYLPEGPIDLNEKMGRLMASMQAAIAGFERSTIRERLHRGNEENRKSGGRFASHLPRGVGYTKERGWFYTAESEQVKRAYEAVLAGESLNDVARLLGMSAMGARYLIHNPIYKGWRIYEREVGESRPGASGRQPRYRPLKKRAADKVIRVKVIDEPLISPEKWEHACRILDIKSEASRRNHQKGRGGLAAYNGFLFCDECGKTLTPVRGSARNHPERVGYYVCLGHYRDKHSCSQGYTRIPELEQQVDKLIGEQLRDPRFFGQIFGRDKDKEAIKVTERIKGLKSQQSSIERKRSRVVDMYADGTINKTEREERIAKITEQLAGIEEELSRLESAPKVITKEMFYELFGVLFDRWSTLDKEERRKVLSRHMPKIRIRDGRVVSLFRLLDSRDVRYDKKSSAP
ncbi:MAG: recombinase family protein [Terracidiphilus sp.]